MPGSFVIGPGRKDRRSRWGVLLVLCLLALHGVGSPAAGGAGGGGGGGGGGVGRVFVTAAGLPPAVPAQFDVTGFLQEATLDTAGNICQAADARLAGGTLKVNNLQVIVPCNTVLQMPAATLTWQELFSLAPRDIGLPLDGNGVPTQTGLALADKLKLPIATPYNGPLPSFEVHVQGNVVDGKYIAGLIFVSQQNLNLAQGVITAIDYDNGELQISTRGVHPGVARVKINDPLGRYGLAHGAPGSTAALQEPGYEVRFSIDEDNPTVHAATGFPMCIPRSDPFAVGDDPDCPQANRPRAPDCASLPAPFPAFAMPAAGQFCTSFTMPAPAGLPCSPAAGVACPPDPTRQAPFEVGDFIDYMGTLKVDSRGAYISAHTLIDHLGIYTTPGAMPAYLSIEMELQGTSAQAVANLPQETTSRVKVEGFSTDPSALVDIYAVDVDPNTGAISDRLLGAANASGPPVIGRFRFKPFAGAFLPPTREFRVVSRTLCGNPAEPCLLSGSPQTYANGIVAGQYHAPNFEFIFPENLTLGDAMVPANLQDLIFLFCGSGPLSTPTAGGNPPMVGQLDPPPWGAPMNNPVFGIFCPKARRITFAGQTLPVAAPPPAPVPAPVAPPPAAAPAVPVIPPAADVPVIPPAPAVPPAVAPAPPLAAPVAGTAAAAAPVVAAAPAAVTSTPPPAAPALPGGGAPVTGSASAPQVVFTSAGATTPAAATVADATAATPAGGTTPTVPPASPTETAPDAGAPSATAFAAPDKVDANQEVTLSVAANDPNTPSRPLGYTWTQIGWPAVAITNATEATATFTAPGVTTPTTLTFNVAVRNSVPLVTNAQVTVLVNPLAAPPSVSFKLPASALAGDPVAMSGAVSSGAGFAWKQTAGPVVALNNASTLKPDFIAPAGPATLSFVLTASNVAGTSAIATRTLRVAPDEVAVGRAVWINGQGNGRLEIVATSSVITPASRTPPSGMGMTAIFWNSALPSSASGSESHPISVPMKLVKDVPGQEAVCGSPLPCFQLSQGGAIPDPDSPPASLVHVQPTTVVVKSSLGGRASVTGARIQLR